MAERIRYLLSYDIREPNRLRHVHRVAMQFGYPLQYSVFICDLTSVELIRMKAALSDAANLGVDSIAIFDLGRPDGRGVECVQFLGVRRPLGGSADPEVW
jgi:CRISPR-associated protein Cas2